MLSPLEIAQVAILSLVGLAVSTLDIRFRIIPNWISLLVLVAGLVFSLASGGLGLAGSALLHAVVALVAGMALFAAGAIGGGDAKFYAAVAAWFGFRDALFLFVTVALSGLVVFIAWFVVRRLVARKKVFGGGEDPFAKLPYGVAIALGASVSTLALGLRA